MRKTAIRLNVTSLTPKYALSSAMEIPLISQSASFDAIKNFPGKFFGGSSSGSRPEMTNIGHFTGSYEPVCHAVVKEN